MSARTRALVMVPICLTFGALLIWALAGLPDFGDFHGTYGRLLATSGVQQRHASNIVAAVVFDYRGLDTLGEEFILFTAAAGVAFLLRASSAVKEQKPPDPLRQDAMRVVGVVAVPLVALTGFWLISYGYVTPGGGFQGGVVVAAALLLIWAAGNYRDFSQVASTAVFDAFEGLGAAGYVGIGLLGLAVSTSYLANFMGIGTTGSLWSTGTIALLNAAAGIEVAAANVLIFREFLIEYVEILPEGQEE